MNWDAAGVSGGASAMSGSVATTVCVELVSGIVAAMSDGGPAMNGDQTLSKNSVAVLEMR
jgi:hypothetical protein